MSINNPLISVIIPTYNRAAFIKDTIESVLNQTYKNYEIIVVDDGSKDNTREIVSSFGERVKYIYIDNSGPSKARNIGIKASQGEFIAFLDSDDLWHSNKLEEQLKVFVGDSRVGVAFSDVRYVNEKGVCIRDSICGRGYVFTGNFIKDVLDIRFPFPSSSAVMVTKKAIMDVGLFDETLRLSEDLDLWVRIALRFKVGYLNQVTVSVRMHDVSLIHQTTGSRIYEQSIRIIGRYKEELKQHVANYDFYEAKFLDFAGNNALLQGDRFLAMKYYLRAICITPLILKRYKDLIRCILPLAYLKRRYETLLQSSGT